LDKSLLPALIGAASGALVAAIGWFAVHGLSTRREVAARRDAAARDHLEKQIEELYGPLLGLIQHSRMAFAVAARRLPTNANKQIDFDRFKDHDGEIWDFFVENFFLPVNAQIRHLIRSKMHLLEAGILPKSFEQFFVHEVQLEALHRLWKEKHVRSPGIVGPGWPMDFEADVQGVLDTLRKRHQAFLRRLGAASAAN
jgi:hypothetical protein